MIIAVWGNSGSGKSTFAIKLANSFSRMKKNVILVDTNYIAPQVNVWFPKMDVKQEESLRVLLDNNVDSVEMIVSKIHVAKDNMGVIGYSKDFSSNMITSRSDTSGEFLSLLPEICDVAIIDCQSDALNDILSFVTLDDAADERLVAITPDVRGLSWYDSNVRMLDEGWTNDKKAYTRLFNQAIITAPVADIENAIGSVKYYLPYSSELQKELYTGTLGGDGHRKNARKYTRVVDTIAKELLSKYK